MRGRPLLLLLLALLLAVPAGAADVLEEEAAILGADTLADVCIKTLRDRDKLCRMTAAYDAFKAISGAKTIYDTLDSECI